jgi:hypothetical protein
MKETIKVPIDVMSAEELVLLTLAEHTGADTISIKATIEPSGGWRPTASRPTTNWLNSSSRSPPTGQHQ